MSPKLRDHSSRLLHLCFPAFFVMSLRPFFFLVPGIWKTRFGDQSRVYQDFTWLERHEGGRVISTSTYSLFYTWFGRVEELGGFKVPPLLKALNRNLRTHTTKQRHAFVGVLFRMPRFHSNLKTSISKLNGGRCHCFVTPIHLQQAFHFARSWSTQHCGASFRIRRSTASASRPPKPETLNPTPPPSPPQAVGLGYTLRLP